MFSAFDSKVIDRQTLALIRACQLRSEAALGGGAALSGAYLGHRLSNDIDLVAPDRDSVQDLVRSLPEIGDELGLPIKVARNAGTFVRATVSSTLELDIVIDSSPKIAPDTILEAIRVVSLEDLRASKLTCLLSRSEPRDLVDVMFLERAGFRPEDDLELASRKDTGLDPVILAWLLAQFPVAPLPRMLVPLTESELDDYRKSLCERLRSNE